MQPRAIGIVAALVGLHCAIHTAKPVERLSSRPEEALLCDEDNLSVENGQAFRSMDGGFVPSKRHPLITIVPF